MEKPTYIIKPVTFDIGSTYKWRASYMESKGPGMGYSAITDVDFSFDTEAEAVEYTHALLMKEGVADAQIITEG